jgi:hypothetical protein
VKYLAKRYPKISVCTFGEIPKSGVTHLTLPLDNVTNGGRDLFDYVEAFREGTTLKTRDNLTTGALMFNAVVPFVSETDKKNRKGSSSRHHHNPPPNTTIPIAVVFAILVLIIVASLRTDGAQWNALMFWK